MADHLRDATKKVDYITREEALDFLIPAYDLNISKQDLRVLGDRLAEFLKNIPAADVVEVVRCKDCRFYYEDSDGYEMCDNSEGYDHISADGFCAWAKRRADNG